MRIAICLHGLIGNTHGKSGDKNFLSQESNKILDYAFNHWEEYILRPNINNNVTIDFFIHSWDTEYEDLINKKFKPITAKYEKQISFNFPTHVRGDNTRIQNHYSRWYSAKESVKLKTKYEKKVGKKYDIVMLARFDIAWNKTILFDNYIDKNFYVPGWINKEDGSIIKSKYKDFWFFSSSKNMSKFCDLYDKLDEYTKPGMCPNNVKLGISSHRLVKFHLEKLNFNVKFLLKATKDNKISDFPLIRYVYFDAKK
jgi:hypothetical protein